jgi:3'(2'), 5'-bisphosphate nucleotidase
MLERELDEAASIARDAARILLEVYATDFSVRMKGREDPVTEADTRANALLVRELRARFPSDGVVAEETADTSDGLRKGRCWYVDPLDGTKEFVSKNGEFSVMLGLAIDGAAVLGVVYQPVGERLYAGVVGQGAFMVESGTRTPLQPTDESDPAKLRLIVSRSHRSPQMDALKQTLGITSERPSGSVGLKVGLIARREADFYVHLSDKAGAWDTCGPEAILRAAGGRFTDLAGDPVRYDGNMRASRGILACNAAAFDAVLPAVRTAARAVGLV